MGIYRLTLDTTPKANRSITSLGAAHAAVHQSIIDRVSDSEFAVLGLCKRVRESTVRFRWMHAPVGAWRWTEYCRSALATLHPSIFLCVCSSPAAPRSAQHSTVLRLLELCSWPDRLVRPGRFYERAIRADDGVPGIRSKQREKEVVVGGTTDSAHLISARVSVACMYFRQFLFFCLFLYPPL